MLPIPLQAARLFLARERPYLSAALWALQPVPKPGLGTMAVDRCFRIYFDPAVADVWSVEQMAGVLYHEILHLLRDHPTRLREWPQEVGNLAADAEINDDLREEKIVLPGTPIFPEALGFPPGKLAEEYAEALQSSRSRSPGADGEAAPGGSPPARPNNGRSTGQQEGENPGREPASDRVSPSSAAGDRTDQETSGGQTASPSSPDRDDAPDSSGGSEAGSSPASRLPQSGASPQLAGGPVSGRTAGPESMSGGRPQGSEADIPRPGAGRCGSCATGRAEPWELSEEEDGENPGVSRAEAEVIRRQVAAAIVEASRGRGNVPGHLRRWANTRLQSRVDWRRILAGVVRRALGHTAGMADYSYRRPGRRQAACRGVILPAMQRPSPSVAVIVDTSESIDGRMISQATAEVAGILRQAGQHGVHVLAVDAAVQAVRRVFHESQVRRILSGGGGTDMGVGLEAAVALRPRPDVVIVLSDCRTSWPEKPPAGMKVIIARLGRDGDIPAWAKVVEVNDGEN